MQVDYIIVGFGIAGISMAFQLEQEGKSVLVIDGNEIKASIVAAGLYNPVILKRFTLAWGAEDHMNYAQQFYKRLSAYLDIPTTHTLPVFRKFNNAQEQNKWFSKVENPQLQKYLSPELFPSPSQGINSEYSFGKVKLTGKVLIADIVSRYRTILSKKNCFLNQEFDSNNLCTTDSGFIYKHINSKNIIFCEGHKMSLNPYFNKLPLVGSKGSYLIIESEGLKLEVAVKSYYFIIPLGGNKYKFGATYGHRFKDVDHDKHAKEELVSKLNTLVNIPYTIIDFVVGVRPTVIDRKPLLGKHKEVKNMFVMNGMGTRGVLLAPTASFHLKKLMLSNIDLPAEMDVKRFY